MSQNTEQQTEQTHSLFEQIALNTLNKLDDSQKNDLLEEAKALLEGLNQKDWNTTQTNFLTDMMSTIENQFDIKTDQEVGLASQESLSIIEPEIGLLAEYSTQASDVPDISETTPLIEWAKTKNGIDIVTDKKHISIPNEQYAQKTVSLLTQEEIDAWYTINYITPYSWTSQLWQTITRRPGFLINSLPNWLVTVMCDLNNPWDADYNSDALMWFDYKVVSANWNDVRTGENYVSFYKSYDIIEKPEQIEEPEDTQPEQKIKLPDWVYLGLGKEWSRLLKEKIEKFEIEWVLDLQNMSMTDEMLSSILSYINRLWKSNKVKSLLLSNNKLNSLPPEITKLVNLTDLNLWGNQLKEIPPEIWDLANLTNLGLSSNQLEEIPPEIWDLANLTKLSLSSNQLQEIPPEIWNLANLTELYLVANQLKEIPPEIWDLVNLTILSLSSNQLKEIPPEVWNFQNLELLDFTQNDLISLPAEITKLVSLKVLELSENQLKEIPPEIWELVNLTSLNLWGNQLTTLPESIWNLVNLTTLDLSNNKLNSLPIEISKIVTHLRLFIWDNENDRKLINNNRELFFTEGNIISELNIVLDDGNIQTIRPRQSQ